MDYNATDEYIFRVIMAGAKKHGLDNAARVVDPLLWYITTGRANYSFLAALAKCKPHLVYNVLYKAAGSHDSALAALIAYVLPR